MGYIGNAPYQGVLTGANIQDGTVDTADIANDAVTTVKMADVSVTAGKLHTTLDLSAKTVTLPDGSVTNAKLASGIDASKLTTGTLPIARIADASITAAKLAAGAAVPVQTGNSGKFLTTDGTNASWGTVDLASRVAKSGDTMTGALSVPTLTSAELMGTAYSTNGGTLDTSITANSGVCWEIFGQINPNSGGSTYVDVVHGYVYLGYGWNGSELTIYSQWVSIAPPAREVYPSGSGNSANIIDVVLWNGTAESDRISSSNASSNTLRIKIPNYNTTFGSNAYFRIARRA